MHEHPHPPLVLSPSTTADHPTPCFDRLVGGCWTAFPVLQWIRQYSGVQKSHEGGPTATVLRTALGMGHLWSASLRAASASVEIYMVFFLRFGDARRERSLYLSLSLSFFVMPPPLPPRATQRQHLIFICRAAVLAARFPVLGGGVG